MCKALIISYFHLLQSAAARMTCRSWCSALGAQGHQSGSEIQENLKPATRKCLVHIIQPAEMASKTLCRPPTSHPCHPKGVSINGKDGKRHQRLANLWTIPVQRLRYEQSSFHRQEAVQSGGGMPCCRVGHCGVQCLCELRSPPEPSFTSWSAIGEHAAHTPEPSAL